ncbi:hypothetical protein C5167_047045 [Papaver somniferum]|uniref:Uncharacterized protein n=1 Tax=Papaver somniferum TaxID=3469 RepID=A0A4Y7LJA7_PAPSO|nr:hypothetical protein C5167_047045 [Papaver somniferum]
MKASYLNFVTSSPQIIKQVAFKKESELQKVVAAVDAAMAMIKELQWRLVRMSAAIGENWRKC